MFPTPNNNDNKIIIIEIHYRKNLAKLKGSAVTINGNKPKGKNTMKEKKQKKTTGSSPTGI